MGLLFRIAPTRLSYHTNIGQVNDNPFRKADSPYCIIFGLQKALFVPKSCGTFRLATMTIFCYHKDTERVIPMI